MLKKGFKVVEKTDMGRLSTNDKFEYRVVYDVGLWVTPIEGWGPLCVFRKRGDAMLFKWWLEKNCVALAPEYEVWECDYAPSRRKNVWEIFMGRKISEKKGNLTAGKELATRVRITRRIT